jgi:acyl dehydratase
MGNGRITAATIETGKDDCPRMFGMVGDKASHAKVVPFRDAKPHQARAGMAVGDNFCKQVRFDATSIASFALLTGDTNPLHHDVEFAKGTRFGGIIASGSHLSALMSGMVAGHFAQKGLNVGLDFTYRFESPVRVDDTVLMRWTLTNRMPKLSLRGDILTLEGQAVRSDGIVAVSATAHVLLLND